MKYNFYKQEKICRHHPLPKKARNNIAEYYKARNKIAEYHVKVKRKEEQYKRQLPTPESTTAQGSQTCKSLLDAQYKSILQIHL